ncbi:hypothetical protein BCR36DRAFT_584748 [Piromyces finnis]|uniref:Uncharacterized protein n=1 Tax=Piromyces finnis TaxID=1754191 RepID=A0A1Y1V6K9_9FUNG|nr:hypothetical protein BCR36DRAFT_584748 [Piromyces finnis]|eukprot:ORX47648.1 hypothetical protein BCR36DRAFT_584748 [Piromyces finnis]
MAFSLIESPFFLWVLLVLLMNGKNWKRPVMLVLIIHWVLRSIGDAITKVLEVETIQDFTVKLHYGIGYATIFWMLGEMVGDWYPYIRTRALLNEKKNLRLVLVICIGFNIVKLYSIYNYFYEEKLEKDYTVPSITQYSLRWWYIVMAIQVFCFSYDLSVILCLKKNLFQRLHDSTFGKGSFVDRFIKISEYRIVVSMIATVLYFPVLLAYIVFLINFTKKGTQIEDANMDKIRQSVLNINYTLMYIDQILLKSYANRAKNNNYDITSSKNKSSSNLHINTLTGSSSSVNSGFPTSSGYPTSGAYSSPGIAATYPSTGFSAANAFASANYPVPGVPEIYRNTTPTSFASTQDNQRNKPQHNVIALDSNYYRQKLKYSNNNTNNNGLEDISIDDDDRYLINKNYNNNNNNNNSKNNPNMKGYDYYNY